MFLYLQCYLLKLSQQQGALVHFSLFQNVFIFTMLFIEGVTATRCFSPFFIISKCFYIYNVIY